MDEVDDVCGTPPIGRRQVLAGLALSGLAACAEPPGRAGTANIGETTPTPDRGMVLDATVLEDALVGSSYLGCGGGGTLAQARELIALDLAAGREFRLLDVADLGDDQRVACPYALGTIAPETEAQAAELERFEGRVDDVAEVAFKTLQDHLDTTFAAVILGEIGPLSMAEGLSIAARLGVPALDADTVGRATPEINQHSVKVSGASLLPAAGVTRLGDRIILRETANDTRPEAVFRALSVAGGGVIGVVDSPITGAVARRDGTLITGSFSLAARIGRAVRAAKADGGDPVAAARVAGDGYDLFAGEITRDDWADDGGFLEGFVEISGTGEYRGQILRLDYKNEHLVATRNGRIIATCPDLITLIDRDTGEGITNPDYAVGQAVAVLGYRSADLWRTPAGLDVFRPRHFGYDVDYVPIEDRLPQP